MQRFRSVSFSTYEFEAAWAALAQASRLAGSGCMIRHYLPLACEVILSPGVLKGFGRRLHRSLTIRIGKKRNRGSAFIILKGVKCIVRIWTARFLEFYLPFCICAGSSLAENGPITILREPSGSSLAENGPIKRLRETRACL